jgi:splicing factor 3B subunit 1
MMGATPGITPGFFTGATPATGFAGMETPATALRVAAQQQVPMTPEQYQDMRLQKEMWERNRPLTDEELDAMMPGEKEGYKVRYMYVCIAVCIT